jgi:MoxR-like ATPase
MSDEWQIFRGSPEKPHSETDRLVKGAPPWRDFTRSTDYRGQTYKAKENEIRLVNAALHLRRPMLVTGPPGSGKSSLAYAIAEELELKPVLKWPINSRTTLNDGLYHYDAIARLRDANLKDARADDITNYLSLSPLGTALASPTPRVLLIDEIDKADMDLPNDLLHILEEGSFVIPELRRLADKQKEIQIATSEDQKQRISIIGGVVQCRTFPVIVMTSNGERELPLAFNRRCLRLQIEEPTHDELISIVNSHLGKVLTEKGVEREKLAELVKRFEIARATGNVMATDQLLNLVYLLFAGSVPPTGGDKPKLEGLLFRGLNQQ